MYLALYRKYRPKTFQDVISQPHITQTLKNEIISNHTAHAYLFTGPRGTGKTTCSKILSMAVNCLNIDDGNPCLVCDNCKAIDDGSTLDVVEIDAASNSGVENIRDLREEANYTPTQCKFRVYIIDEVHMLSMSAFNALLKIMEEPPSHVKFILATTELHKVPATILSRCQKFDFRRIQIQDIKDRLQLISQNEDFTLDDDAATLVARLANGGMRDACSILDQCIAFSKNVTMETVASASGIVSKDYLYELADCLIENDAAKSIDVIDKLYGMSKDLQNLLSEFIHLMRNIMLKLTLKETNELIVALPDELEKIDELSKKISLSSVLNYLTILEECLNKISHSSDKKLTLELTFVKLCTPVMNVNVDFLVSRIEKLEIYIDALKNNTVTLQNNPSQLSNTNNIVGNNTMDKVNSEVTTPIAQEEKSVSPPILNKLNNNDYVIVDNWSQILTTIFKKHPPLSGVLRDSRAFTKGDTLYIRTSSQTAINLMKKENNIEMLITLIEEMLGIRYKISMKPPKNNSQSTVTSESKLEAIIQKAKENGVEINEN